MACLTECNNDMEYSPDVEFLQNYNDKMITCLTQLQQRDKEAEFLKEHCGDGWHDEAPNKPEKEDQYLKKHCGDGWIDSPICNMTKCKDHEKGTYDMSKINPCMYNSKEISINKDQNTASHHQQTDHDKRDDSESDCLSDAMRNCLFNEKSHKTMINVKVLTTEGKYNQQKNKLMDSGANRGLTRYANLLHKYRRIKRIPITGIGENGAATLLESDTWILRLLMENILNAKCTMHWIVGAL